MRNLIKNVFRSFRTAKIALIALTFLIFVAVGSFVLLNNTVNNFNASFQHVTEQGQLSNAIINERYDFGKLEFQKTSNDATSSSQPSVSTRSTLTAQKANGANSSFTLTLTPDSRTSFINNALQLKPDVYNSLVTVTFSYGSESDQTKKTQIEEQSKLIAANNLSRALQTDKELLVTGQLEQLKATFRTYKAINITDQGVFKKLIASEPTDQVNRLVLFDGHQLARSRQVEFNELFSQFTQVQAKGKDQLSTTLKNGNYEQLLQAIANNFGSSETELLKEIQDALKQTNSSTTLAQTQSSQQFSKLKNLFDSGSTFTNIAGKLTLQWMEGTNKKQLVIFDPSSYETVVAPGNWSYEQQQGKAVYQDINHWNRIKRLPFNEFEREFQKIDKRYKMLVDKIEYLILGVGITPDFVYPVFSESLLIPNTANEQLYYVNQTGYERTASSFLTNPTETGIVARLPNLNHDLDVINQWAVKNMSWPPNLKAAYSNTDTTNILNLLAARTVFIPNLINTISLVSSFLTIAILLVAIFVTILILVSYLKKNTEQIGILKANGVSGRKINLSLLIFSLIPGIVGSFIGYTLGISMQNVAINLFSNYWFIPTQTSSFSVLGLLFFALLVVLMMSGISLFVGWLILRQDVVKILKHDSEFKVSHLGLWAKWLFAKFGIMTRFRVALAFNAPWKLVFLTLMSALTMMILNLSFATKDAFQVAQTKTTLTQSNHQYEFELASPTEQSGLLKWQLFAELGATDDRTNDAVKLANRRMEIQSVDESKKWKNQQVINFVTDATGFSNDINYLENIVQSKIGLDYSLGFGNVSSNPWKLSETLMPANQASASNTAFQNFLKAIIVIDPNEGGKYIKQTKDEVTVRFLYEIDSSKALKNGNTKSVNKIQKSTAAPQAQQGQSNQLMLDNDFAKFLYKQFNLIKEGGKADPVDLNNFDFANQNQIKRFYSKYNALPPVDYKLAFNVIGLPKETIANQKDAPLFGFLTLQAQLGNDAIKIKGIKDWKLDNTNLGPVLRTNEDEIINQRLFSKPNGIIINSSAAKKYRLKEGSQLHVKIHNGYKRVNAKLVNQDPILTATFNIVGINNSVHEPEFYTSYKTAATLLQYPNEWIEKQLPFNSFYANSILPFTQSTSLFSESGLFPGTSSFAANNTVLTEVIKKTIEGGKTNSKTDVQKRAAQATANGKYNSSQNNKMNYERLQKALGITSDLDSSKAGEYATILERVYDGLPYNSTISFISNVQANDALFANIANTTQQIQTAAIGIIIPIIMLIVLLVSTTLIQELKKIAIRLKALGYSNPKILLSFLSIYLPLFIFGLLISIPISIYLIALHNQVIFSSAAILLEATLNFPTVILSMLVLSGVLSITFVLNWLELNKIKIAKEIKNS